MWLVKNTLASLAVGAATFLAGCNHKEPEVKESSPTTVIHPEAQRQNSQGIHEAEKLPRDTLPLKSVWQMPSLKAIEDEMSENSSIKKSLIDGQDSIKTGSLDEVMNSWIVNHQDWLIKTGSLDKINTQNSLINKRFTTATIIALYCHELTAAAKYLKLQTVDANDVLKEANFSELEAQIFKLRSDLGLYYLADYEKYWIKVNQKWLEENEYGDLIKSINATGLNEPDIQKFNRAKIQYAEEVLIPKARRNDRPSINI